MKKNLFILFILGLFCCLNMNVARATQQCPNTSITVEGGATNSTFVLNSNMTAADVAFSGTVTINYDGENANDDAMEYTFVLADANNNILTLDPTGAFDMNNYPAGQYGVHVFGYVQTQLDQVCALICGPSWSTLCPAFGLTPDQCTSVSDFVCSNPCSLASLVGLIGELGTSGGASVFTVDSVITALPLQFCTAVANSATEPAYTITVEQGGPEGDSCDAPVYIYPNPDGIASYGPYTNVGATVEPTDVFPACFGEPQFGGPEAVDGTVWFTFYGDGGYYHIYTDNGDLSAADYIGGGDTQMAVYTGSCGAFTEIDCNEDDDTAPDFDADGVYPAGVYLQTEAGVQYHIMVDGFMYQGDIATGQFYVVFSPETPPPACEANLDLTADSPATVSICNNVSTVVATIDIAATNYGYELEGQAGASVIWAISPDPNNPFATGVQYALGYPLSNNASFALTGNGTGTTVYVTGFLANVDLVAGSFGFVDCTAQTATVAVTHLVAGAAGCVDPCEVANIDFAANTPTSFDLCPEDSGSVMLDLATLNFGPDSEDPALTPFVFCFYSTVAPTGNPLDLDDPPILDANLPDEMGNVALAYNDTVSTYFVSCTYVVSDGEAFYVPSCDIYTATVQVNSLAANAAPCVVVADLTTSAPTTMVAGETYVVSFDISGGTAPYTVNGAASGSTFTSSPIACGTDFTFSVADAAGATQTVNGVAPCQLDPLSVNNLTTAVSDDNYSVTFTISGGVAPYAVNGTPSESVFSTTIPCGTPFAFTVTDSAGDVQAVSGNAPCDVAPTCAASFGTVVAPDFAATCGGVLSFAANGAATGDYTTIWAITQGANHVLQGYSVSSDIDFSGYTAGNYTVHAFNFLSSQADTILNTIVIGQTTGGDVAALIANGTICGALDLTGTAVEVLAPLSLSYDITCVQATGEVIVTFTISGGYAPGYNTTGYYSGTDNPFTISFLDGAQINLVVSDGVCGEISYGNFFECTKCTDNAGALMFPSAGGDAQILCTGTSSTADVVGEDLEGNYVVVYAVHSNSGNTAGTIYATGNDGSFSFGELSGASYNTVYYISAIIGPVDDNGNLDMGSECTVIVPGTPVVYLSPITIQFDESCNKNTGESTLGFVFDGGFPDFDSGATYTYTSNFGSGGSDTSLLVTLVDGTAWTLTVTDANGCTATLDGTVDCVKTTDVELISFTGEVLPAGNNLKWATATEINNNYFLISRSNDGVNFEVIDQVAGNGTTTTPHSYQLLDKEAPSGLSYYQLTQVDFDGSTTQSPIISLNRGELAFGIATLLPVPVLNDLQVIYNATKAETVEFVINDVTGRTLLRTTSNADVNGNNVETLNVASFPAGVYFVTVSNGKEISVAKFVK